MSFRKPKDPEEEMQKQRLTKYSSIAQKYSQLKAEKQGRSTDGKEVHWKKLVPPEYWKWGDRFDKDKEKRLSKSTKWDMKIALEQEPPKKSTIYALSP